MKHKKLKISLISAAVAIFMLVASLTVYAYFTTRVYVYTEDGKEVAHVGMNLQLLFGKLDTTVAAGTDLKIPSYNVVDANGADVTDDKGNWIAIAGDGQYLHYNDGVNDKTLYDPDAPWGSAQNPYVISEPRHLQNLSALQSVGYFDMLYIGDNYTSGNYNEGSAAIPYFVICETDGTPVNIDGSEINVPIKPIGSAEHPFIGVIGGAFKDGTTTVAMADDGTGGKLSSVSAIDNFKVKTNTDQVDVGLFGYIGYMGTEPTTAGDTFYGVVSIVKNVLVSDVQVVVKNPSALEVASEFIAHVFENHRFTFTGVPEANLGSVPHEDHHIGIFAGHVSYAHLEYISVYYSSNNICAIDLMHIKDTDEDNLEENYHSSTGIVGFMHNMNATVTNTSGKHCQVEYGGISSSGINVTPDTPGAGGGQEIGVERGYVVAKTLYEGCHFIQSNQGMYDRIWRFTINGTAAYGPVFYDMENGTYRSQNGNSVVINVDTGRATETLAGGSTKAYNTYAIRTPHPTKPGEYVFTFYNYGSNKDATGSDVEFTPVSNPLTYKEENPPLNTEIPQNIWEYVEKKPVDSSGNPIEDQGQWSWTEAVLVHEGANQTYYLTDSLFEVQYPVTVSLDPNTGTYSAAITGAYYADGTTAVTIARVFFLRADGTYSLTPTSAGAAKVPEFFREKPLLVADAKTMQGTDLCLQSDYSEGKYFYDGVFTFALSDPKDIIESTWENETPDQIVLGTNSDAAWQESLQSGFYGVVAYIKPVKSEDFQALAESNTPIFIGYHDTYTDKGMDDENKEIPDWTGESLSLLTLLEKNPNQSAWDYGADNFYSAVSATKAFFTEKDRQDIIHLMDDYIAGINDAEMDFVPNVGSGLTVQELYNGVEDGTIQLLNLESASDLTRLMNYYRITPSSSSSGYQFTQKDSSDKTTYLSIVRSRHSLLGGLRQYYSIYSGTDKPDSASGALFGQYNFDWNTYASVAAVGDAFNISYTYGNNAATRFLRYNNGEFDGVSEANTTTTNMYFYTIEAMTYVKTGQVVYEPVEGITSNNTFNADEYVLWPQAILKNDGTYNGTYNGFDEIAKGSVSTTTIAGATHNAEDTKTDGGVYDTYRLLSLSDLFAQDNGWQDGYGNALSNLNLRKKYTMQEAVDFSVNLYLPWWDIGNISTNNNSVLAQVGKGGALANIPTGSVAFRINEDEKNPDESYCVYVIVSVPTSKFYEGASDEESLTSEWDYYLGLWEIRDMDEDQPGFDYFAQDTALQKFELPRSQPYDPETATVADSDYILVEHSTDGGKTYETKRCYLNGERALVAYRFTVQNPGTYVLGTAVGDSNIFESTQYSYPMEIVYCAADNTADDGLDGTKGSVIGSIDYVYHYGGNIVHVQDYTTTPTVTPDTKYNYYYNSHIVTYTDNEYTVSGGFASLNNLMVYPQRYIPSDGGTSTIRVLLHGAENQPDALMFKGKHLGVDTDTLIIDPPTYDRPDDASS